MAEHAAQQPAAAGPTPLRFCAAVLLEHTPAAQPPHVDLMIAPPGDASRDPDARTLLTWRLSDLPPLASPGATFAASRLRDHRRLYLTFEGPMSADRGFIRRLEALHVAFGPHPDHARPADADHLSLVIHHRAGRSLFDAHRTCDARQPEGDSTPPRGEWTFTVLDHQRHPRARSGAS